MNEILLRPATELSALVRDRVVSSRELLDLCREQIEACNPDLNAVVTTDWDHAQHQAHAADEAIAADRPVGRLHGLPMTVKDVFETAGLRTTAGAPELEHHVPDRDAVAVSRLRAAGAIIVGKSNVPTWAGDCQSTNPIFGTTSNPWDVTRTPGGSSGGAAAATAVGMTALELGSDLGGSIRIPAHFCGVYGLKPTHGLVPLRGHLPPGPGSLLDLDIAVAGPLSRSADDLGLALDVLAGPDERAAVAWRLALPPPRADHLHGYRVGVWADDPACPPDAPTTAALDTLITGLRGAGVHVVDVGDRLPAQADALRVFHRIVHPIAALGIDDAEFDQLARLATGGDDWPSNVAGRAVDQLRASGERAVMAARWAEVFRDVDVVITPVTPTAAFPHDHDPDVGRRRIPADGGWRPYGEQFGWLQSVGLVHLPAVVAPLPDAGPLPIGVQIVGPHLEDRTPIDFASRLAEVGVRFLAPPGLPVSSSSRCLTLRQKSETIGR